MFRWGDYNKQAKGEMLHIECVACLHSVIFNTKEYGNNSRKYQRLQNIL